MINQEDIIEIDREYFDIIGEKDFVLVLRSRSTGHYWSLLEQVYNGHRTFRISHKHKASDPYHFQRNKPSVAACCEYIRDHDEYHLERIRKKEERRLHRTIDRIVDKPV